MPPSPNNPAPKLLADGVAAARARICARRAPLAAERIALREAAGRTLAHDLIAPRDQPPFRASAMDGYALRYADVPRAAQEAALSASTAGLTVIGEAAAGRPYPGHLAAGEAVRIFTGAAVPEGADAVVPQERTERAADGRLLLERGYAERLERGANIRAAAIDFAAGARLIAAGTCLTGRHVALIAAAGLATFDVRRRPRLALLANGNELRAPGEPAGPFEIYDSVTFGLGAMIEDWGGLARLAAAAAPDSEAAVAAAVQACASDADALVIVGGASVGDYDLVKRTLTALGLDLQVAAVAIRPGKPTWFGTLDGLPVLGLPGNPAAAFVCAQLFVRALIDTLLGRSHEPELVVALLEGNLPATGEQEHYVRASARVAGDGRLVVKPDARQDTSLVSVYAASNALIRRAAGSPAAAEGTLVEILRLA